MIIHSKFRDYYDSALSLGRDETLHFVRETSEVDDDSKLYDSAVGYDRDNYMSRKFSFAWRGSEISLFPIWFCGKIYVGIKLNVCATGKMIGDKYYYQQNDFNGLEEHLNEDKIFLDGLNDKFYFRSKDKLSYIESMKRKCIEMSDKENIQTFIDRKVAYFVRDHSEVRDERGYFNNKIMYYPMLKKYNFQVVKDPFTAMQEISMFLGGVIPRQGPEIINISDKDRIAQHGFNKQSFRHPVKIRDLYGLK